MSQPGLRILHVNDYASAGGCEVVVGRLVELLRKRGHEVRTFTSDDVPGHRRTPLGYIHSRRARRALEATLADFEPHVVHLHNFYHELSPSVLSALAGPGRPRVVMTAHDFHLVCPNPALQVVERGTVKRLEPTEAPRRKTMRQRRWDHRSAWHSHLKVAQHLRNYGGRDRRHVIDVILCPSRFMQGVLARAGLPARHLPNPAPALEAIEARRPERLRLVFAGRLEPEKGVAGFLAALPEDFTGDIEIVGDGSERARCEAIVERRGLTDRVAFAGRVAPDESARRIATAHVLVLPSLWYENQPVCLLEALALGTNILVSNLGGMAEIVEDAGAGWTFDPEDPSSLARALAVVATARDEGTLNAFDAKPFLETCSGDRVIDALEEIYAGT